MLKRLFLLACFKIVKLLLSFLPRLTESRRAVESNEDHLELARMNDYKREMYIERNTGYNGKLLWRMPDYRAHRREAIDLNVLSVTSPPCYICRFGYKYSLRVNLEGYSDLSISVLQMKTEYDSFLKWPVNHRMQITLFCREDQTKNKVWTSKDCVMQKPGYGEEVVRKWHYVHPIASLERDGFVVNDCMFIELKVE